MSRTTKQDFRNLVSQFDDTLEEDTEAHIAPLSVSIRPSEHWAVVGATGSGKSRFNEGLVEYFRRQWPGYARYILDTTGDGFNYTVGRQIVEGDSIPGLLPKRSAYTQIWQPYTRDSERYGAWFEQILSRREPCIVLIDEVKSIQSDSGALPYGYELLLGQGRKHNITVVTSSYTIKSIAAVFEQMTHYAQFFINHDRFNMSMSRQFLNLREEEQRDPKGPYGFFYRRTRSRTPAREYRDMQEFFGRSIRF